MRNPIYALLTACLTLGSLSAQQYKAYQALQDQWEAEQADNKGYVWTITINSKDNIEIPGLVDVDYKMKASISHVGPTLNGIFGGNVTISAHRNTDGVESLFSLIGGSLELSQGSDLECECDGFLMNVHGYDAGIDQKWQSQFGEEGMYVDMNSSERMQVRSAMNMVMGDYQPRQKNFEQDSHPVGFGAITETKLKDVFFENAKLSIHNGWYQGVFDGFVSMGSVGHDAENAYLDDPETTAFASSRVRTFWGQSITGDIYLKMPSLPLILRIFPNNQVVMELYSSTGGPFVAKFYGKIDRIPVENTVTATKRLVNKPLPTAETDDYSDVKAKDAARKQAELAAAQAVADAKTAEDTEFLNKWDEHLSAFPRWEEGGSEYDLQDLSCEGQEIWALSMQSDTDLTPAYIEKALQAGFRKLEGSDGTWFKVVNGRYMGISLDTTEGWFDKEEHWLQIFFLELADEELARAKKMNK